MSHPALLTLKTITCLATEDVIGSDDLTGVMGADHFRIGSFRAGDSR